MEPLMKYTLGPIIYKLEREWIPVSVHMISYTPKTVQIRELPQGRSRMLSDLSEEVERNLGILQILSVLFHIQKRCVIVISERTAQLHELKRLLPLEPYSVPLNVIGLSMGEVRRARRQEIYQNDEYRVLLTTSQLSREALDVPRLDTLVYATPTSDPIQSTGRVLREHPNKKTPLVIDIADLLDGFRSATAARRRYYCSQNYDVRTFESFVGYLDFFSRTEERKAEENKEE
jgi:superfamily II DNA or RNA helicase